MCLSSFDDYECGGYADDSLDVWDGSVDTSWFDESSIQDSYELDTAAKLAGLAKLISDSGTANWPYAAAEKEEIERILAALSRRVGALADDLSAVAAALGELLEYPVASVRKYDTELLESA